MKIWTRLLTPLLLACCLVSPGSPLQAQARAAESGEQQASLVAQLGDTSYSVRERAARHLLNRGLAAKPVLLEALRNPDLEIRLRAHQLLVQILQSDFESHLTAFVTDSRDGPEHNFPGWQAFRELAGKDRPSRELFAQMLRLEGELLQGFEAQEPALNERFTQRVNSMVGRGGFSATEPAIPAASVATVVFLASDKTIRKNSTVGSQVYMLLTRASAKQSILHGPRSPIMRQLLAHWIVGLEGSSQTYHGLQTALNYEMPDAGLTLARRALKEQASYSIAIQYAAIVLGRWGEQADIPILVPYLDNESVTHRWRPAKLKEMVDTQVRDVVLAVLIHMTGQDHKKYGFEMLEKDETQIFRSHTCGFPKQDQRTDALNQWHQWYQDWPEAKKLQAARKVDNN